MAEHEKSIYLGMPWHSTSSDNGWEADIWAGDSSAHIATISISEKSKDDVRAIADAIVTAHNAALAARTTPIAGSEPVAWRWRRNTAPEGYTHPTIARIGGMWHDVETQGMPDADDLAIEALGTSHIEYAYTNPTKAGADADARRDDEQRTIAWLNDERMGRHTP